MRQEDSAASFECENCDRVFLRGEKEESELGDTRTPRRREIFAGVNKAVITFTGEILGNSGDLAVILIPATSPTDLGWTYVT
jgi:hypothetical protein